MCHYNQKGLLLVKLELLYFLNLYILQLVDSHMDNSQICQSGKTFWNSLTRVNHLNCKFTSGASCFSPLEYLWTVGKVGFQIAVTAADSYSQGGNETAHNWAHWRLVALVQLKHLNIYIIEIHHSSLSLFKSGCQQHWWAVIGDLQGWPVNCAGLARDHSPESWPCDADPLTDTVSVSHYRLNTKESHFIHCFVQCIILHEWSNVSLLLVTIFFPRVSLMFKWRGQ